MLERCVYMGKRRDSLSKVLFQNLNGSIHIKEYIFFFFFTLCKSLAGEGSRGIERERDRKERETCQSFPLLKCYKVVNIHHTAEH